MEIRERRCVLQRIRETREPPMEKTAMTARDDDVERMNTIVKIEKDRNAQGGEN